MEIVNTDHPLRTMTLRYDRSVDVPEFEREGLAYYSEIHDRAWEIKQRIENARLQIPHFNMQIEELEALFGEAKAKFSHLQIAYDTNPYKPTLREQLKKLLIKMEQLMESFVPEMIKLTLEFFEFDEYIFQQEKWMYDEAFPRFSEIIIRYKECAVDMVFLDSDLDDFKGVLSFVKRQEGKYIADMDGLVEKYSDVNDAIEQFHEAVEEFDESIMSAAYAVRKPVTPIRK